MADAAETVPLIVSAPKPLEAFRIRTVFAAPLIVTGLEAAVNTEPAPDVSQIPATVHEPEVVIVPENPPDIVPLMPLTTDVPRHKVASCMPTRLPPCAVKASVAS